MIKNHIKIAWRNLWRNKFYSFINIGGLALSVSCCIIIYLFITFHLSYDTRQSKAPLIYRVVTDLNFGDGKLEYLPGAPMAMRQALINEVPEVKGAAFAYKNRSFTVAIPQADDSDQLFAEHQSAAFADDNWFKLFGGDVEGHLTKNVLSEPNTAVLTRKQAKKYFGNDDVVGKTITLDKVPVKVIGVIDDHPANTDDQTAIYISLSSIRNFYPDMAKPFQTDWQYINNGNQLFVLVANDGAVDKVNRYLKDHVKDHFGDNANAFHFWLQPLKEVHFDARYGGTIQRSLLVILSIVGMLLLIISCVNFLNMATAQSTKRAKEIGTRRVLGSSKSHIFWQFITETALIVIAAMMTGTVLALMFLPVLSNWIQVPLDLKFKFELVWFILALLLVCVFAGGVYPATVLSRFKPVNALKNMLGNSIGSSVIARKLLLVGQNVIAQVLIICALLVTQQVDFLKTTDMGFDKSAVVMVPLPDHSDNKLYHLRQQLSVNPQIKSLSFCYRAPAATENKGGSVKIDDAPWANFVARSTIGDTAYLKTFGMRLLAGRNITASNTAKEVLVNELLMQRLGFKSAGQILGHQLVVGDFGDQKHTIVGVVRNFNMQSLSKPFEPDLIASNADFYQYMAVKIGDNAGLGSVEKVWKSAFPQSGFEYSFVDDQIAAFYQKEDMINKIIKASTGIAIFISCLGLLGLVSLLTVHRVKEIGIRKVLGASVGSIVHLISKDFIRLVGFSLLIATPVAWYIMHLWLQGFAYRIEIKWWVFAFAGLFSVIIAFITISFRSVKAAVANPVKSLRSE
jgi:putative ABC transport system permease protein